MIGIYKITSPTNRIYIGQSVDIEKRFNSYNRMYVKNQGPVNSTKNWTNYLLFTINCKL